MSDQPAKKSLKCFLQEYSIPLIAGVGVALVAANLTPHLYHSIVHWKPLGGPDLHFLMNEIFMVFFFGIAAKEITESCLKGGALNPVSKAINPLFATIGGVAGPIAVYFGLVYATGGAEQYANGWGIPTATDIALAWVVARAVFGKSHPAVNFLLLLAVADDAIGMGIIAIFYPDPAHPVQPVWMLLIAVGMGMAFAMRRLQVQAWQPYIFGPGAIAWMGLYSAHLHPALALVFVVPFLPSAETDDGLFVEEEEEEYQATHRPNALHDFEHQLKSFVDFGLFAFAFCNAGVVFGDIGPATWYVLIALAVGKTIGITGCAMLAEKLGFPLPQGMKMKHVVVTGVIAGMGLTVALFVSGEAFTGTAQAEAKMGALLSGLLAFAAIGLGRLWKLNVAPVPESVFESETTPAEEALPAPAATPVESAAADSSEIPAAREAAEEDREEVLG